MSTFIKKLEQLHEKKWIEAIDLERCRFFQRQDTSVSDEILKTIILAGKHYRQGHICLSMHRLAGQPILEDGEGSDHFTVPPIDIWKKALDESSLVGSPDSFKPLIVDGDRVYFQKLWKREQQLGQSLIEKARKTADDVDVDILAEGLERLFRFGEADNETDWQKVAAAAAVLNHLTVISGGPGTGKTTTVVRMLVLLLEQHQDEIFNIALVAPTGKAAARLKKSIRGQLQDLNADQSTIEKIPEKTFTLHRLLGVRRDSATSKYNEENRLPFDLVVVDEVSMADQRMMNNLLKAMKSSARLILLGDKDQLASVEAGSVLGDICGDIDNNFSKEFHHKLKKSGISLPKKTVQPTALTDNVVLLKKNYRFNNNAGILKLTAAIKNGASEDVTGLLNNEQFKDIQLKPIEKFDYFWQLLEPELNNYFEAVNKQQSFSQLFEQLQRFNILCAHRSGQFGVQAVNREIEKILRRENLAAGLDEWYEGRPIIIRQNDYRLGLRNGDIGICQRDDAGAWIIVFPSSDQSDRNEGRRVRPGRLPEFDPAYALTIHQSQGSEFEKVFIVLPNRKSKILSRELFYTAVTRAKKAVTVFGAEKIVTTMVEQTLDRYSGLGDLLKE